MKSLFDTSGLQCCKLVTHTYSTSFSLGIQLLHPDVRPAIYAIYGFVRYADEIVDTFLEYEQATLLEEFVQDYHKALERGISLNPILNTFQAVVQQYDLCHLVDSFLESMRMDLYKNDYQSNEEYERYIYGSADVVGLMCLKVFVKGDETAYQQLRPYAMRLGSAFQKVNFLRDIKDDYEMLNRSYFPNLQQNQLDEHNKTAIIRDIENDFKEAYKGIVKLPTEARLGVYVAYRYYLKLLYQLQKKSARQILRQRVRVSNPHKMLILCHSYLRYKANFL